MMKELIGAGAKVNEPAYGFGGRTALQIAVQTGNSTVVDLLLEHKADVNAPPAEDQGRTALQATAEGGYLAVVN